MYLQLAGASQPILPTSTIFLYVVCLSRCISWFYDFTQHTTTFQQPHLSLAVLFDFCFLFSFCFTLPLLKKISRVYVRRKVRIRTIFRKPRILALLRKSSDRVLRKRRPRVAIFYIFSTLSASGRFASKGSFVSFLVCFRARYYCTLRSLASQNKEPRLLSSRTPTCNRERYAAKGNSALACEDQTKVWRKLVSTARSEACGLGTAYEICLRNPRIVARS